MAPYHATHTPMTPWKQCLVAAQVAFSCITVAGIAQWLCVPIATQMAERGAGCGYLVTYGRYYCYIACATRHAGSRHVSELRHRIPADELATKVDLQSPDRNLGVCCVALWSCGGAFAVIWIWLKDQIDGYDCLYIPIKQPATLHFKRH